MAALDGNRPRMLWCTGFVGRHLHVPVGCGGSPAWGRLRRRGTSGDARSSGGRRRTLCSWAGARR